MSSSSPERRGVHKRSKTLPAKPHLADSDLLGQDQGITLDSKNRIKASMIQSASEFNAGRLTPIRLSEEKMKARASVCIGAVRKRSGSGASSLRYHGGTGKNLLVDLDKVEKTAGMFKVRRRKSISTGDIYEAKKFKLEFSRNGVLEDVIRSEWRKAHFRSLYQTIKRCKMLRRLQRRGNVPDLVIKHRSEARNRGSSGADERAAFTTSKSVLVDKKTRKSSAPAQQIARGVSQSSVGRSLRARGGVGAHEPRVSGTKGAGSRPGSRNGFGVANRVMTLKKSKSNEFPRTGSRIFVIQKQLSTQQVLLVSKTAPAAVAPSTPREVKSGNYGGDGFVFLTRHGEREDHVNPKWYLNAPNVFDPPLSERGLRQASELGVFLRKTERITHIIASPFTRTVETAIEVAKKVGVKVLVDYGLAEHVEPEQFRRTCKRLDFDANTYKIRVNSYDELLKRYPEYIARPNASGVKLSVWPAKHPETEEHLFERTDNTVKHVGMFAFEKRANVLLVSHQTPVEYMAFELCKDAEDKFVSVCCLTKAKPVKEDPKKRGWALLYQHDDSFLSEPELGRH